MAGYSELKELVNDGKQWGCFAVHHTDVSSDFATINKEIRFLYTNLSSMHRSSAASRCSGTHRNRVIGAAFSNMLQFFAPRGSAVHNVP